MTCWARGAAAQRSPPPTRRPNAQPWVRQGLGLLRLSCWTAGSCRGWCSPCAPARTELECAEARLRAARSEASAAAAAEQNSLDQWQQRVTEADEDAARLRADNLRLEKSLQQASAEERMLAELVQQEPQRAEEVTSRIRAECHRLERQNKRLLLTIAQGRGQLNSLHAEAVRDRLRGQPPPRTQGCAGRLVQRHGSSPVLRGSWQAG
mmetsp:Transcript_111198/g.354709  ORF Transcript_111198/g.354709 Transcript_111198/m.354709 type:complete len:208 (-) Transcript_111198:115-738(-)